MKHVITKIQIKLLESMTGGALTLDLPIIPGTGHITSKTSNDGLTEDVTVTSRLRARYPLSTTYLADLKLVTVSYSDDEASGSIKSISFGTTEIPARFTLEDSETMAVKCVYKRIL